MVIAGTINRVAFYCRVNHRDRDYEKYLDDVMRRLEEEYGKQKWDLQIFFEEASGADPNRKEFNRLKAEIAAKKIDVVVTMRAATIARNWGQFMEFMEHKSGLIKVMDEKCNSSDLAIALDGNTKIIATTIQKFPYIVDDVANLKNKKFAVIIDEAHSSTAGKDMAAVTMTLGSGEVSIDESTTEDLIVEEIAKHGKQENVWLYIRYG